MVDAWDIYDGKRVQRKRSPPLWTPHDEWVIKEKPITEEEDPKKHKEKEIQEFKQKEKECQEAEQREYERRLKANNKIKSQSTRETTK